MSLRASASKLQPRSRVPDGAHDPTVGGSLGSRAPPAGSVGDDAVKPNRTATSQPPPGSRHKQRQTGFGITGLLVPSLAALLLSPTKEVCEESVHSGALATLAPVAAVLLLLVVGPALLSERFDGRRIQEAEFTPSRIVPHELLEGGGPYVQTPALRGCCGEPAEFRWVFLDGTVGATAGAPFRTRVLALDSQGRQARPSACGAFAVDLGITGRRAWLSPETSPPTWQGAELRLDIESEVAGLVQAEVRIASPDPAADVLLHTSQIRFASGPAHQLAMSVHAVGEAAGEGDADEAGDVMDDRSNDAASSTWQTGATLEVVVTLRDRFGNRVSPSPAGDSKTGGVGLLGVGGSGLALRSTSSSVASLEVMPVDGHLHLDQSGRGVCSIRGTRAVVVEIWLEYIGGNATAPQQHKLREKTRRHLRFADSSAGGRHGLNAADARWQSVAEEVKTAFAHAWRGYKQYAWGRDELQPLSRQGRDSFGGIGMTILDSLTTLWLMGFRDEFDEAVRFVESDLRFDRADGDVSVFELIIRALGGLLGAYALSGRKVLLDRAHDLGSRLLPALNTSSKLPWPKWNLAKGRGYSIGEPTILAEAGSLQLEYRYLAAQTGNATFKIAADLTFAAIQSTGITGLMPVYLTPPEHPQVRVLASKFAIGALADSYYEYLLKQWLQSPHEDYFKQLWLHVVDELPGMVAPRPSSGSYKGKKAPAFKLLEVKPNGEKIWKMDHLSCFTPAMLALGLRTLPRADLLANNRNSTLWTLAEGVTESCAEMWTGSRSGLAPEFALVEPRSPHTFREVPEGAKHSFLRPETAESLFYLYRFTEDERYRRWGEQMFRAILTNAKVDAGFASVEDVTVSPTAKMDEMQSFVMAETFKYLYLLFSPADALDLDRFVLNTEGHPLPRGRLKRQTK